jgi:GYF domain 2
MISEEKLVPTQWFYSQDGRMMLGPCTSVEMKHLASTGQILPTYRVRRKGRIKTVMARNVKGLFVPAAE